MYKHSGFTLLELIVTIVIVGVLAVTVASRFANEDTFAVRIEQENLISTLNLAQQLAMTGRTIAFTIDADNKRYSLSVDGSDYQVTGVSYPLHFQDEVSSITASTALPLDYSNSLGQTTETTFTISSIGGDSLCVMVNNSGFARAITCL